MHKKSKKVVALALTALFLVSAFVGTVQGEGWEEGGNEGCTPGFWKNHTELWSDQPVSEVFAGVEGYSGVDGASMLDALRFKGGKGEEGAVRILLRAAVAAWLNANSMYYYYPPEQVEYDVNTALYTGDRAEMLRVASELDSHNNGVCVSPQPGPVDPVPELPGY